MRAGPTKASLRRRSGDASSVTWPDCTFDSSKPLQGLTTHRSVPASADTSVIGTSSFAYGDLGVPATIELDGRKSCRSSCDAGVG